MVRTYETFNDIHNFYIFLNVHGFCVINFQNMNTTEIGKGSVWVLFFFFEHFLIYLFICSEFCHTLK